MPLIDKLMRPEIAALEAYTPIVPLDRLAEQLGLPIEQLIKLDANENPYGPAPKALAALANQPYYAIYPDPESNHLWSALAAHLGVPREQILCGAGADEVIDLLLRLLFSPRDRVIDCPPNFGMYAFDTLLNAGQVVAVPRRADFSLDLPAIEQAARMSGAKLLFLTSPNNPTGNLTSAEEIQRLLELPLIVVVDEAYIEFAESNGSADSVVSWVAEHDNLVVLRTFSKWAGLAGLRVGYAVADQRLLAHLLKIKQPYNVNLAGQVAALASLADLEHLQVSVRAIVAERANLFAALAEIPYLEPIPSAANFILCRVTSGAASDLKQQLAQRGILVRHYRNSLLNNYVRISVGTPEQHERLLAELQSLSEAFSTPVNYEETSSL